MTRKIRYGKKVCPICGFMVTKNAMGRASHMRNCTTEKAHEHRRKLDEQAREKMRSPFKMEPLKSHWTWPQ